MEYFVAGAVGIIIWAIRLEGRINTSEARYTDLKELISTRFDASDQRLERIERKVLNGSGSH